jgi:hypothetical protein
MTAREPDGGSGMRIWLILGVVILVIAWILFLKMQEPLAVRTPPAPGDAGSSKR